MKILVLGIFEHRSDAALAIEDLRKGGIKAKQISAVTKQKNTLDMISHDTGIGRTESGAGNEGLFGTARGLGAGLDMVPETAVAAGPAASKLAGADLDIDGLAVSLISMGIPQEDAESYARHADMEHIIVIVALEEERRKEQISTLFEQHHAIPLGSP
ncbi:general stress protein [Paenibacillus sp. S150]|uniref:general stress protein n=1 Tax=Paenibacillus sp. S150 TaxID=2749826 RepID=UPI001C59289D|nr:general stress protein [Paenibacillus sp. S150]MBW4081889.1 general stress protein [Paenibacillus sp. S150]